MFLKIFLCSFIDHQLTHLYITPHHGPAMRFVASHGFTEVLPWPLDADGHDLSVIRNQVHGPVSYFVHGSREDFMGVWQYSR